MNGRHTISEQSPLAPPALPGEGESPPHHQSAHCRTLQHRVPGVRTSVSSTPGLNSICLIMTMNLHNAVYSLIAQPQMLISPQVRMSQDELQDYSCLRTMIACIACAIIWALDLHLVLERVIK